jgi:hypothetical protein
MAQFKWTKKKKKKGIVMPLSKATPPEPLPPPSNLDSSSGVQLPKNPTLDISDRTKLLNTKKKMKTALAVTFSTTTSSPPLLTGDDLFVACLLSDGMKMNTDTNNTTPPLLPKNPKKHYQGCFQNRSLCLL